jgi:hypothetical protein
VCGFSGSDSGSKLLKACVTRHVRGNGKHENAKPRRYSASSLSDLDQHCYLGSFIVDQQMDWSYRRRRVCVRFKAYRVEPRLGGLQPGGSGNRGSHRLALTHATACKKLSQLIVRKQPVRKGMLIRFSSVTTTSCVLDEA